MAEVLSQSQIDALLQSMQEGGGDEAAEPQVEEPEKKYQKYNFYSPKKFTKDKLRIVSNVYENYARMVSTQISSLFRVPSEMDLGTVEEQRFYEFRNALAEHDMLTLVNVVLPDTTSKNPPALIHVSPELILMIIDRMLGGVGDAEEVGADYVYSDIERELYKSIVYYLVSGFNDSWANYVKLQANLQGIDDSPHMIQIIGLDEIVILCVIDVTMGDLEGKITICLPSGLMDNLFRIYDRQSGTEKEFIVDGRDTRDMIMESLQISALEVKAQLPDVEISLNDVYNLQIGDVINLNQPKDTDVELVIANKTWFKGQVGLKNKNMAVEIKDLHDQVLDLLNKEQGADQAPGFR